MSRDAIRSAAFTDFMSARSASLYRTAYLIVGDHQLAQDLVQESLIKTYVAWSRLRDVGNAEAYTRRTIVTTAISLDFSSATLFRISRPLLAPSDVERATTSGMASPSAWGQAMISTVTSRSSAISTFFVIRNQTTKAMIPAVTAT